MTFALLAFAPAPQPTAIPATVANNSNRNKVVHLLLREGTPKTRRAEKITPPPTETVALLLAWAADDAAVVLMMSVAVTAEAPVIAGGAVTEHVGASDAPMGPPETEQLRATVPVKPPRGLIVIVDVPFGPGAAMVTAVLLSMKPGGAVGTAGTLTAKLVIALRLPAEAAVTVTV